MFCIQEPEQEQPHTRHEAEIDQSPYNSNCSNNAVPSLNIQGSRSECKKIWERNETYRCENKKQLTASPHVLHVEWGTSIWLTAALSHNECQCPHDIIVLKNNRVHSVDALQHDKVIGENGSALLCFDVIMSTEYYHHRHIILYAYDYSKSASRLGQCRYM